MTPKELFGVVVRSIGLWYILSGCHGMFGLIAMDDKFNPVAGHVVASTVVAIGIGVFLFMCPGIVTDIAYRTKTIRDLARERHSSD